MSEQERHARVELMNALCRAYDELAGATPQVLAHLANGAPERDELAGIKARIDKLRDGIANKLLTTRDPRLGPPGPAVLPPRP